MRITVGSPGSSRRNLKFDGMPTSAEIQRFEKLVKDNILDQAEDIIFDVSNPRLKRLTADIMEAARVEAYRMFDEIGHLIDGGAEGISHPSGSLWWPDLSYKYAIWKSSFLRGRAGRKKEHARMRSSYTGANNFFRLSGGLQSYFQRQGRSIIASRFGGVSADVKLQGNSDNRTIRSREGRRELDIELGRIQVQIFPRISPALMPMLASGRWTDTPKRAAFERAMLPKGVADKLSGGRGPYRPLVLPITQLWIIHRIPGAISREIDRSLKTTLKSNAIK